MSNTVTNKGNKMTFNEIAKEIANETIAKNIDCDFIEHLFIGDKLAGRGMSRTLSMEVCEVVAELRKQSN